MASSCGYKGCRVPAEDHSEFCIFHSPSPKDVGEFQQALTSQIKEEGPDDDRNGRYIYDGYIFPTHVVAGHIRGVVGIQMPNLIEGYASFYGATITGDAWFSGAEMKGGACFDGVAIEGSAYFDGVLIEDNAGFNGAKIAGNAVFNAAIITGHISFDDSEIEGDAFFSGATIEGSASFNGARIKFSVWFDDTLIKGKGSFNRFDCETLHLRRDAPRISGWGNRRCGIHIAEAEAAVSFWRFAQRIFSVMGEREKADASFYFERLNHWRVLRRTKKVRTGRPKAQRQWANWSIRLWYWVCFFSDLVFVRWTTAYGASVGRLIFTWFAVIGGFGVIFSMFPRFIGRASEQMQIWTLRNWIVGIHYSATTFSTLGLGRISPGDSRLGMVLTSVEAILGAVLIALAVLVIGRRFMRQG